MIILDLKLKNILGFENIHLNFSYKRKLKFNSIGTECLKDVPNFRFKKVNVVFGSNSSGKSCLGRVIWGICLFFKNKESKHVTDLIAEGHNTAFISIDYVSKISNSLVLNRVSIKMKRTNDENNPFVVMMARDISSLRKNDTYESAAESFNAEPEYEDYLTCLNDVKYNGGWLVAMPITEQGFSTFDCKIEKESLPEFTDILFKVLNTLDPNIASVSPSTEIERAFIINYEDGKNTIVKDGDKIADIRYLSTGTKYGFSIASVIFGIKNHNNGFYYVDELFSYINSDIEIATLSLLISLLGDHEQLFFTTHNTEILNMSLPLHSFTFLGKEKQDGKNVIKKVLASDIENRNNVVVKNLYDNDVFGIAPNVEKIIDIEAK